LRADPLAHLKRVKEQENVEFETFSKINADFELQQQLARLDSMIEAISGKRLTYAGLTA